MVRRILDLRITRWPIKLAYIAAFCALRFPAVAILSALGVPSLAVIVIDSLAILGAIFLGARLFRGKGENLAKARPWWQLTAWPKLSRRLGIALTIANVLTLIYVILLATGVTDPRPSSPLTLSEWIATLAFNVFIAFLYLNSAIRQTRTGVVAAARPVVPTFKPWSKLD